MASMLLTAPSVGQVVPGPFDHHNQIVCADQDSAVALTAAYEDKPDQAEELLARLAKHGLCERAVFSGKPSADVYGSKTQDRRRDLHVFEVEVTKGLVLKGKTKVFMLLYIFHDNEV
jgi:hypothetical protein